MKLDEIKLADAAYNVGDGSIPAWLAEVVTEAILADIRAQGFRIVPEEPTEAMKMAGASAITAEIMKANANYDGACDCWSAMLLAAEGDGE